jgi:streptogramin lyase
MLSFTDFPITKDPRPVEEPIATTIATGTDGTIWASDPARGRVVRLSEDGAVKKYRIPRGAEPMSMAVGKDASLWFLDATTHRITHLLRGGGTQELKLPNSHGRTYTPLALTVGPDGNVWCTANYRTPGQVDFPIVARITRGGRISEFQLPTGNYTHTNLPDTITTWPDGNLYLLDDDRLIRVDTAGRSEIVPGNYPSAHKHLITRPDGDLGAPGFRSLSVGERRTSVSTRCSMILEPMGGLRPRMRKRERRPGLTATCGSSIPATTGTGRATPSGSSMLAET